MKFTVERKVLLKMLKFVSIGGIKDKYLRIAAQSGRLDLEVEDIAGTSVEANVEKEGVCFFRHKEFMPLLRTYKDTKKLTIEIDSDEIKFGTTIISRARWEISLFENPLSAPKRLFLNSSAIPLPADPQKQFKL